MNHKTMAMQQRPKLGLFTSKGKTSFQESLRAAKMQELSKKQTSDLSDKEKRLVNSASVLRTKYFTKPGYMTNKGMPDTINVQSSPTDYNFNQVLNTSTSIPIKPFIKSSPTGIYSQKNINTGFSEFMKQLKNTPSISDVSSPDSRTFQVKRDFQSAAFRFNPKTLTLDTKGWNLEIPKEYIKVSDTHYIAPSKTYTDNYRYTKYDGKKSDTDKRTASYTPVEIFLQDGKNKIKQILKRETYDPYEYSKDTDRSRIRETNTDVFLSQEQNFFDTGLLKQRKDWDDYVKEYHRSERDNSDMETTYRDIYQKDEWQYAPTGYLKDYKNWGTYQTNDKYTQTDSYRSTVQQAQPFLRNQQEYDDQGALNRQRAWSPYVSNEEYKYGPKSGYNINQKTAIKKDEFFDAGKKIASFKYNDYLTSQDKKEQQRVYRDGNFNNWEPLSSVFKVKKETEKNKESSLLLPQSSEFTTQGIPKSVYGTSSEKYGTVSLTGKQYNTPFDLKYNDAMILPTYIEKSKYNTALQEEEYYDPFTGKPIETFKYW